MKKLEQILESLVEAEWDTVFWQGTLAAYLVLLKVACPTIKQANLPQSDLDRFLSGWCPGTGLHPKTPQEWDDPYRFFRW